MDLEQYANIGKRLDREMYTCEDFYTLDFTNKNFSGSCFVDVRFSGTILKNANFSNSKMGGVYFHGADIQEADFTDIEVYNDLSISIPVLFYECKGKARFLRGSEPETPPLFLPLVEIRDWAHLIIIGRTHMRIGDSTFTHEEWATNAYRDNKRFKDLCYTLGGGIYESEIIDIIPSLLPVCKYYKNKTLI